MTSRRRLEASCIRDAFFHPIYFLSPSLILHPRLPPFHRPSIELTYNSFLVSLPLTPLKTTSSASPVCCRAEESLRVSTGLVLTPFSRSAAHKAAPTWLVTDNQRCSFGYGLVRLQVKMMETTGTRPRTIEIVPKLVVSIDSIAGIESYAV